MNQGLRGDGVGEDVDGDCPLLMRGALVMTMEMIPPSQREVSPAEQLCQSPRLVPPRFRLVAAESRPERLLNVFFSSKDFIQEKMGIGEPPGGPRGRGRAPHPREQGVGPLAFIFGDDFSLFILRYSVEFQDFWSCAEQSFNICSFSSPEFQLPAFSLLM